jgi:NAD(P)-dependent dehydrogenase (short-subunit alcohol dehydrogenase family)
MGEALARHYACADSVLALISRRPFPGTLPGTAEHFSIDVTNVPALKAAARGFVERHGAPDLVIANAGVRAARTATTSTTSTSCGGYST